MGGGMGAPQQQQQQPVMTPMAGAPQQPEWGGDSLHSASVHSQQVAPPPVAPAPIAANNAVPVQVAPMMAESQGSFAAHAYASAQEAPPTPQQHYQPPTLNQGPPSPTKAELQSLKGETLKAENLFRSTSVMVRQFSTEVDKLESAAQKAQAEVQTLEPKTKKGSFGGKKKKAKKEYEKAMEIANREKSKVANAREQLAGAEKVANNAKNQMVEMRQKYEQMELEAATAASVQEGRSGEVSMGVHQGQQQQYAQQQQYGQQQQLAGANQYSDPFGGGQMQAAAPAAGGESYGMGGGMGGGVGGDYDNPF